MKFEDAKKNDPVHVALDGKNYPGIIIDTFPHIEAIKVEIMTSRTKVKRDWVAASCVNRRTGPAIPPKED